MRFEKKSDGLVQTWSRMILEGSSNGSEECSHAGRGGCPTNSQVAIEIFESRFMAVFLERMRLANKGKVSATLTTGHPGPLNEPEKAGIVRGCLYLVNMMQAVNM